TRATDALFDHDWAHLGLPTGFFLLRNAAQGKTLDLVGHRQDEGAELGLHPIKQPLLQGVSLQHKGNNQLFCLGWDGHLIAAASSRPVDVQDWRLVQAFPHPIMTLHSRLSHPPARFRLDPATSTLHVLFDSDPLFRGPAGSDDWRSDDFVVEAVPRRRRKRAGNSAWSAASEQAGQVLSGLGSTAATLGGKLSAFGLFSGLGSGGGGGSTGSASSSQQTSPKIGSEPSTMAAPSVPPVSSGSAELTEETSSLSLPASRTLTTDSDSLRRTIHVEHGNESDADSDSDSEPAAYRSLRVVRLEPGWREKYPAEALRAAPDKSFGVTRWSSSPKELRQWRRRVWDVIPVTIRRLPAPHFPVHNSVAGPMSAGGGGDPAAPRSAVSESRTVSASQSDSHEDDASQDEGLYTEEQDDDDDEYTRQHRAPPGMYAMADYFGIGSHETSGASSPVESRSRRPSTHVAAAAVNSMAHDLRRWSRSSATETLAHIPPMTAAAASHLTGLLSSRLLPLSLAPGQAGEFIDDTTEVDESTPRLPRDEWDASEVDSRALDDLARERQTSSSNSSSAGASASGEGPMDAETPRQETGPVPPRLERTTTERPSAAASSAEKDRVT
ncbi:hypothetical protein JCM3774_004576, partial [Rhodotorula dairenensis]